MKKIACLKGFSYISIDPELTLTAESAPDYFKNEILNNEKVKWNGQKITMSDNNPPAFDSGIVCCLNSKLSIMSKHIDSLNCFFAPYQLMNETIKARKPTDKVKLRHQKNSVAIGIGMVLSIVAAKGSAETNIRQPYMLFVNRGNLGVRNGELDVPVVEGLNCSDFELKNGDYVAKLEKIAIRALQEERGLNIQLLNSMGLLHMPKNYYLGYDKDYMQWNFFGTIIIDCTIEEIVREGFYYTKDKFESSKIIAIPADPQTLYYHLSERTFPKKRAVDDTVEQFWNTAWASVSFALRDFSNHSQHKEYRSAFDERFFHIEKACPTLIAPIRKSINWLAKHFSRFGRAIELGCGLLSVVTLGVFLYSLTKSDVNIINDIISLAMTLSTCWLVIAVARNEKVSKDGIIEIELNTTSNKYLIPEIRVFDEVTLVDGFIGQERRSIFIEHERINDGNINEGIVVQRKCKAFYDALDGCKKWEMIKDKNSEEHIKWIIKSSMDSKKRLRIVFPCIYNRKILFRSGSYFAHIVDFEIPYKDIPIDSAKKTIQTIKDKIIQEVGVRIIHDSIDFHFLMKYKEQYAIVGFVQLEQPLSYHDFYDLTYDLTNTTMHLKMKDEITRVACEYAIAEHIGYKMSNR